MLLELMLIVYLLVGGAAFLLNCVAKVRQFSDTTKFHPAELC
mgnify:CR=1 FL=1